MTRRTEGRATEAELAAAGVEWFQRVAELERVNPAAADRLYRAAWAHLAATRPESPAALSETIAPTEEVPTEAPRGEA